MVNFVIGANEIDKHYVNVNVEDLQVDYFADIKCAREGDLCPRCGGVVRTVRGIEVGHIFKLGTRYTKALECKYLDEQGKVISEVPQIGDYCFIGPGAKIFGGCKVRK